MKVISYYKGILAEYLCMLRLKLGGHRILGRRIQTPIGEIDLLTQKSGVIYVVEVKYRTCSLDDAKIALLRSKKRVYNAYKLLKLTGPVKFMYFVMSGVVYEFDYMDYL